MTKRRLQVFVMTLAVAAGVVRPSYGWDHFGHMMVACVAYQNLNATAKQRVDDLVQLNPMAGVWSGWIPAGTSAQDSKMMLFMIAATWPDQIKSDPNYTSDGNGGGDRPDGSPDPTANTGYSDMLMHKYWHFKDNPFTQDGTALPPIPTPNAQERIGLFRGVLASGSGDPLKSYDLCWLLHLVGDVHQPLHCATRVSATDKKNDPGDHGGNLVTLSSPKDLHLFWDDVMGSGSPSNSVKKAVKAANKLPAPEPTLAAKTSENDWVNESFQAAQDTVYTPPIGAGFGPFTLTSAYKKQAKALAAQRMALAGARLANLINNELK